MRASRDKATGQFIGDTEKKTKKIWVRIPNDLYDQLLEASQGNIPDFARMALIEKINKDIA